MSDVCGGVLVRNSVSSDSVSEVFMGYSRAYSSVRHQKRTLNVMISYLQLVVSRASKQQHTSLMHQILFYYKA